MTSLETRIAQARGDAPADLVLRGGTVFDLITGEAIRGDVAIGGDRIVGVGEDYEAERVIDVSGLTLVPGFIDTHLHIESSLVTPFEFDRCVLPLGITTAICDPHEIANVIGAANDAAAVANGGENAGNGATARAASAARVVLGAAAPAATDATDAVVVDAGVRAASPSPASPTTPLPSS